MALSPNPLELDPNPLLTKTVTIHTAGGSTVVGTVTAVAAGWLTVTVPARGGMASYPVLVNTTQVTSIDQPAT